MQPNLNIPYSATAISIIARIIFMYLLYTKKSVNNLSLTFCIMNIASSSLWMKYSLETGESPLILRSSVDIILFVISAGYIINNKIILRNYETISHDNPPTLSLVVAENGTTEDITANE